MKKIQVSDPFPLIVKAFKATKQETVISLQILFCITAMSAIVFYFYEHNAQPEVFSKFWQSMAWALTQYIGNANSVMDKTPITLVGKIVAAILGLVSIAVVAIPAGLIGSGLMDAIAVSKREKEIEDFKQRLEKSFKRKQCRYTKYRTVPHYVSIVDIQAKQGIDTKDVLDAVSASKHFRLRNLATAQPLGKQIDRLVVEHFPMNTSYGCCIDRSSNVTIVSTSSVQETGTGNFAYYLALFGGFNYVSKEIELNTDEPFSYYNIDNETDDSNITSFLSDIKKLERSMKNWVIFLLSASGAEEPVYSTQVHWIHGSKKGDSSYSNPNITVKDIDTYHNLYLATSTMLKDKFDLESDQQKYHAGSSKMYIGRHVGDSDSEKEINAFTLRLDFSITVWDDRRIHIAKEIAALISENLANKSFEENENWKAKGIGYID